MLKTWKLRSVSILERWENPSSVEAYPSSLSVEVERDLGRRFSAWPHSSHGPLLEALDRIQNRGRKLRYLSNLLPGVSCAIDFKAAKIRVEIEEIKIAHRMELASQLAQVDLTVRLLHNKGIFNGLMPWSFATLAGHRSRSPCLCCTKFLGLSHWTVSRKFPWRDHPLDKKEARLAQPNGSSQPPGAFCY